MEAVDLPDTSNDVIDAEFKVNSNLLRNVNWERAIYLAQFIYSFIRSFIEHNI